MIMVVNRVCFNYSITVGALLVIFHFIGETRIGSEVQGLFGHSQSKIKSEPRAGALGTASESLLARADRLCKELRPGKGITNRRKNSKPYNRPSVSKEFQKNLVVVDFQLIDNSHWLIVSHTLMLLS